ncbi:aspartic peptidase domain-containing protein [Bisporella sp. PMI_857]|nr:aspartic peptidase domain-containing protein [Bisporella sp. PMI_857]
MKPVVASLLIAARLLSLTQATGTVQLDLITKRGYHSIRDLQSRSNGNDADETTLPQDGAYTRYYANVTIGEPGQNIQLHVDTGSSDVWVIAKDAEVNPPAFEFPKGTPGGTFDFNASSTASWPYVGGLNISYLDGSGAFGDLFADSLTVAGTKLDKYIMGLAKKASLGRGILGLGFSEGLSFSKIQNITSGNKKNLVDAMVAADQITSQAYSLWLNDIDSSSGALLFGGVDSKKYEGSLANLAMYPTPGKQDIDHFTVSFTSFSISTPSGNVSITPENYALPAVLDSGATQTIVPDDIAHAIYAQTGATYFAAFNVAVVPCSVRNVPGTFDFGFGGPNGPIIRVPIGDMIYPGVFAGQHQLIPNTTQQACVFGITPASTRGLGPGMATPFGDTFLRSAYVVYDLANKRIGMAQTKYNSTESNILKFESQGAQIPDATTVSDERKFTVTELQRPTPFVQQPPTFSGESTGAAPTPSAADTGAPAGSTTSPAATSSSPSAASSRPRPFAWEQLTTLGISMAMFMAGGVLFL